MNKNQSNKLTIFLDSILTTLFLIMSILFIVDTLDKFRGGDGINAFYLSNYLVVVITLLGFIMLIRGYVKKISSKYNYLYIASFLSSIIVWGIALSLEKSSLENLVTGLVSAIIVILFILKIKSS